MLLDITDNTRARERTTNLRLGNFPSGYLLEVGAAVAKETQFLLLIRTMASSDLFRTHQSP